MQDDISQLLILNKKANVEQQIFASELEKFRPHQQRISATIQHQQQAIQELTAAFKDLMEGTEAQKLHTQHEKAEKAQKSLAMDLKEAKAIYDEVREGLGKGIQFYRGLQDTIDSLQRNVQRFVNERTAERRRLIEEIESTKSTHEQTLLKETLNKYTAPPVAPQQPLQPAILQHPSQPVMPQHSAPPVVPQHPPPPAVPTTTQLINQTRQLSLNEPSAPYQYTPTPPPKPQGILQQQAPPYSGYGYPQQQQQQQPQQQQPSPAVYTPPAYTPVVSNQRPAYSGQTMYPTNYASPQVQSYTPTQVPQPNYIPPPTPQQQQQQQQSQQQQHGYILPQQQQGYYSPQQQGFMPLQHQTYPQQPMQNFAPPQNFTQPNFQGQYHPQQQGYPPYQQQQQQQQPYASQNRPPSNSLLD